jgi:RNase P/RNase MRP subunit p29
MSTTTIAIANRLSDWLTDTSGATGTQGDLIRESAQQQIQAASTVGSFGDQQGTVVDKTRPTLSLSFPDKPRSQVKEVTFTPLQEWEGYVIEVDGETFTARLLDLTNDSVQKEEEADFPVDELSEADQSLLQPGAIFRWSVGYRRTRGGTKERVSRIVLRRLPAWTERELRENRRKAKALAAALRGE